MGRVDYDSLRSVVVARLQDQLPASVSVFGLTEPPPFPEADDGDDTPETRWAALVNLVPATVGRRCNPGDAHQQTVAVTVSVGASSTALRNDPLRAQKDADLVAAALEGHTAETGTVRFDIEAADAAPAPAAGGHPRHAVYIVTAAGVAQSL